MCDVDVELVRQWSRAYDDVNRGTRDEFEENAILDWISRQHEPKYLNKEYFVRLGRWKTPRYHDTRKANQEKTIIQVTRLAYRMQGDLNKLQILRSLRGVGIAVASTILYFLEPDRYAIFDYHVRNALNKKHCWDRGKDDNTERAWLEYVDVMRKLAAQIGVDLRTLEKALFAYDKYGDEASAACS
jgi:thermostable 8-oxoguanine DNA glycosylase